MKKILASLLCCGLMLCAGVPVYAAGSDPAPEIIITDGAAPDDAETTMVQMPPATIPRIEVEPVQVRMEMVGEVPYITKTYELGRSAGLSFMVMSTEQIPFSDSQRSK